ncbi:MAG: stage 0 sporulation family protein [Oscillospiraceae bacterium]|nr:stage 0 sporulation family protein [Oscillospiraceae bacterium]
MEEILTNELPQEHEVVDIQFRPGQKIYFFDPAGLKLKNGDHVIIDTSRGVEYGYCTGGNHKIARKDIVAPLRPVLRIATAQDEKTAAENREKEKKAYAMCMQKIVELGLDMQLVSAECAFDGTRILFFFTADERVDFRELVKMLASAFHTRIELRQIGVRDKAKMVGGLGICGRPFCCASFLDDFQPVSIKMAKTQSLSLNPTKISGTCGRLMCCLKYEQDAYEDLLRHAPKAESFVDTPEGRGTVIEVDLLRQQVKVKLEDRPDTIVTAKNKDIAVFRSGKPKKTDEPIPADWAPISGSGKRVKKTQEPEEAPILESIKLRYSEETIAEQLDAPAVEEKNPHRRRRHNRDPRPEKPQQEKATQAEKPEAPKGAPKAEAQEKKPNRRNFHRRRRPAGDKKTEG